ncbi:hypothetical protein NX059_011719 [Plenodomus lindquistii]|nr:hypothetical protein NX059_011719 [Plenodomus lindquistii]
MAIAAFILDDSFNYSVYHIAIAGLVLFSCYAIGNAIYQLYFSPLSKFPGPKLAAITLWYEFYYDVIKWGRYWVEVNKMHEKYGPIVRISPSELHVADPSFLDTLYTRSAPRDRYSFLTGQFGNELTTFSTNSHQLHRIRRGAISPFFSKQRVFGLQGPVWAHVEKLCTRLEEFKASQRPIPLGDAFGCLTADVIIEYSLGVEQNALDDPDFAPLFTQAVRKTASMGTYGKWLPWIPHVINSLPQGLMAKLDPNLGAMLAFRRMNDQRVREVFDRKEQNKQKFNHEDSEAAVQHTVFDDLLDSDLPPQEKTLERLSQESQLIVGAGLDTTAHALTAIFFHLLDNPSTYAKLKEELAVAMPEKFQQKSLIELEQIPYLTAVINEALRMDNGVSCRNSRIAHSPMVYGDYTIPAHTPVGMSSPNIHSNETIFPDAKSFIPERWLDSNGALGARTFDGRPLDRYLMAFGRGARQCVGMNLSRAEMCIATAALVRRFDMELFETTRKDVDMVHDLFLPNPDLSSKGVRVMAR